MNNKILYLWVLLLAINPLYAIQTSAEESLQKVKRSFIHNIKSFIQCIKNDVDCDPETEKIIDQGKKLIGLLIIIGIGIGVIYFGTKKPKLSELPENKRKQIIGEFNLVLVSGNIPYASQLLNNYAFDQDTLSKSLYLIGHTTRKDFKNNADQIASLLIDKGALVNWRAPDKIQMTPLMMAAGARNGPVIRILLEKGADRTLTDTKGKTAFDYAVKSNASDEIKKALNPEYKPMQDID